MAVVNFNSYELTRRPGRDTFTVTLFDGSVDDVPDTLKGLIEWACDLLAQVPDEYKDAATFDFSSGYDGDPDELEVSWSRPETDAEWSERIHSDVLRCIHEAFEVERREKMVLRDLLKKYQEPPK